MDEVVVKPSEPYEQLLKLRSISAGDKLCVASSGELTVEDASSTVGAIKRTLRRDGRAFTVSALDNFSLRVFHVYLMAKGDAEGVVTGLQHWHESCLDTANALRTLARTYLDAEDPETASCIDRVVSLIQMCGVEFGTMAAPPAPPAPAAVDVDVVVPIQPAAPSSSTSSSVVMVDAECQTDGPHRAQSSPISGGAIPRQWLEGSTPRRFIGVSAGCPAGGPVDVEEALPVEFSHTTIPVVGSVTRTHSRKGTHARALEKYTSST